MNIKQLQKNWDTFGKLDPLWAILVHPGKENRKWDKDEFFKTGEKEIDRAINYVQSLNISISNTKALDFGCGIGRLTQPLCKYFDEVSGIDIAPSMIRLAKKYNTHEDKCQYYLNETNDLKIFPDNHFDFIYSVITLQHMKPKYAKNYIKEFIRILSPNGLLVFGLPYQKSKNLKTALHQLCPRWVWDLYRQLKYKNHPRMDMYGIEQTEIHKFIASHNAKIIHIKENNSAGLEWKSCNYYIKKL